MNFQVPNHCKGKTIENIWMKIMLKFFKIYHFLAHSIFRSENWNPEKKWFMVETQDSWYPILNTLF